MRKQFLSIACAFLIISCNNEQKTAEQSSTPTPPAVDAKPAPAEFADPKYSEIGKKGIAALSAGDIDGWMAAYADNAVYVWNNGDSLAGKPLIAEYWKKRRTDIIETINFSNTIWLPVKVNQPQANEDPGTWLLSWYQVDAKYKTGKMMKQWIHTAMHFNSEDKIDRVIQYLDRVPINEALKK
jgi:ketosteroid isomerase-like protein